MYLISVRYFGHYYVLFVGGMCIAFLKWTYVQVSFQATLANHVQPDYGYRCCNHLVHVHVLRVCFLAARSCALSFSPCPYW